ncbi:hypothetical protein BST95_01200 [Halioglobus japonicus]|uniref:Uncharacterized protein n=1 Tax=Halioglobus japonicus TaxID=930805 RepID=A0AAP8MBW3_9GAMM|nr:hypothetical protein BST95_01200 [Halioglobus japonicus]PLW84940.1 hypothetical protein C0029_15465 [Halioglobus japonicus]GHD18633.1 hypothetical protein GCM10007052_26180 [Halioglobus japonicus]
MKKRLTLHIGDFNTGSTALQTSLSENRDKLYQRGINYPASARPRSKPISYGVLSLSTLDEFGEHTPEW